MTAAADFDLSAPRRMSPARVAMLCAAMVAIGPLAMALYTPAMPIIAAEFGAGAEGAKLTLSAYFAGFALAQLVAGPLSDAIGRKATLYVFFALFSAATIWAVGATSIEGLIAARALQGVGASAGIAVSRAVVRDLFTGDASSKIMNAIGLMLAIGPAIAPTIGGLTLQVAPWQAVFALIAARICAPGAALTSKLMVPGPSKRTTEVPQPRAEPTPLIV